MMSDNSQTRDGVDTLTTVLLGAAAGAVGVWALDRLDWFMWNSENAETRRRTGAVRPNGEAPAETLVTKLETATGQDTSPGTHTALSQAAHYAIGIAPAIGYALFRDKLPVRGVERGALYGLGLFAMQDEVLNSVTGLGAKPQDYPWQDHARGLLAHTLYGVTTELALTWAEQALGRREHAAA